VLSLVNTLYHHPTSHRPRHPPSADPLS